MEWCVEGTCGMACYSEMITEAGLGWVGLGCAVPIR